jgi:hypothetical protein
MTPADQYRVKAVEMAARAKAERGRPLQKAEYERLSQSYLRLAEQADRNSQNDVVWYDPLVDKPPDRTPALQQQQPQRKDEDPAGE